MNDISLTGININSNTDLSKAAEDISGIIKDSHHGVAKIFYAFFGPFVEQRVGLAKRIAAQTERDCQDILTGHMKFDETSGVAILNKNQTSLDALCEELEHFNTECKNKRFLAAFRDAVDAIRKAPAESISSEPLDQTLINHWRAEAELIDEEDLRKLWTSLLVEETIKPHSISLRTLDVVKNLSKQEANAFCRIAQGVVNNAVVIRDKGFPIFGQYNEILSLQDARLISSQESTVTFLANNEYQQKKQTVIPIFESNIAIAIEKEKISFNVHTLTMAGREIYSIIKTPLELDKIISIIHEISKQNQNSVAYILPIKIINTSADGQTTYKCFWNPIWSNAPTMSSKE